MESVNDYYSAIQLRSDRWSALREATAALARGRQRAPDRSSSRTGRGAASTRCRSIEPYWAFPGMAAFDHLRRQLEHGNYEDLAFSVHRVTRALTTGAYRRRRIPLDRDSMEPDEHDDEAMLSPEARALTKPYFEVLIVDQVNEQQERWLKSNVEPDAPPRGPVHLRERWWCRASRTR